MGLFSKLGSMGINILSTKGVRKVGGNSKVIKTTAQTIGSKIPAIAGGKATRKVVADVTAKTANNFARVAGKVALGTGLVGGAVVGSTKVYDYVQDTRFKTPEQRQAEQAFELWDDVNKSNEKYSENSPSGLTDDNGSNFQNFYDDVKDQDTAEAGKSGLSLGLIAGAGAVVGGLYLANKKGYFKKRK